MRTGSESILTAPSKLTKARRWTKSSRSTTSASTTRPRRGRSFHRHLQMRTEKPSFQLSQIMTKMGAQSSKLMTILSFRLGLKSNWHRMTHRQLWTPTRVCLNSSLRWMNLALRSRRVSMTTCRCCLSWLPSMCAFLAQTLLKLVAKTWQPWTHFLCSNLVTKSANTKLGSSILRSLRGIWN